MRIRKRTLIKTFLISTAFVMSVYYDHPLFAFLYGVTIVVAFLFVDIKEEDNDI